MTDVDEAVYQDALRVVLRGRPGQPDPTVEDLFPVVAALVSAHIHSRSGGGDMAAVADELTMELIELGPVVAIGSVLGVVRCVVRYASAKLGRPAEEIWADVAQIMSRASEVDRG
jgi:hypothetical protein